MAYLTEILNAAPAVANVRSYAETVAAKWQARHAIAIGHKITALGYAGGEPGLIIAGAVEELSALRAPATATCELLDGGALAAPLPEIDHLVREIGLVAGGGAPHLIAGYGFSGKTVAAQALALALAAGRPVWGLYSARPLRGVHVDLEQGRRLTSRRYQRLAAPMKVDLSSLGDALVVAVMPPITLSVEHSEQWRELMIGRDFIIVDSLRAATAGADENDSKIRSGLDMLGQLSERTGCRAIVLHHARKPSDNAEGGRYAIRGSGAIFDACDSVYLFAAAQGDPVRVEHVKARSHGEPTDSFALVISDVEVDGQARGGLRVQVHGTELVNERREEREAAAHREEVRRDAETVRKIVGSRPGIASTDLKAAARISGDRFSRAIAELGNAVEVRDQPTGRGPAKRLHFLRGPS